MMKYKKYFGHIEYDDKAKIFHGEVIGLKDVITFQGTTVDEIEKAFKDSIDDYLSWCKERGEKPENLIPENLSAICLACLKIISFLVFLPNEL